MDITREPFYVDGTSGKAIEFIDRYREYIELPKSNLYDSSEISISFWVKGPVNDKQDKPLGTCYFSRKHRRGKWMVF